MRSIIGRFLEHSRLYWFENGGAPEVFLGSADLMERNLDRRVEVLCRVADTSIVAHLREVVLQSYLTDTARAYLLVDDKYQHPVVAPDTTPVSAQDFLLEWCATTPSTKGAADDHAAEGATRDWSQ